MVTVTTEQFPINGAPKAGPSSHLVMGPLKKALVISGYLLNDPMIP
jgi:hypothetical protein